MRTRHGSATVILLAPACLLFALFVIYPLARGIALSFYDWNDVDAKVWVGLGNYRELAADPVFRTALANNLRWLACYAVAPALGSRWPCFSVSDCAACASFARSSSWRSS